MWVDNTATLAVGNDFTHETVKHVTVNVQFIQECVRRKMILLASIRTYQSISDIMAKQSTGPQFREFSSAQRLFYGYKRWNRYASGRLAAMQAIADIQRTLRNQRTRKRIFARQECDD